MAAAMGLGGLSRLVDAETRSITAENPLGEKGRGAMALPDDTNRFKKDLRVTIQALRKGREVSGDQTRINERIN